MNGMFYRLCRTCKQEKPVKYYIAQWQKQYQMPLPFPYCAECAAKKEGLTLYSTWVAILDACDYAKRNNARLS